MLANPNPNPNPNQALAEAAAAAARVDDAERAAQEMADPATRACRLGLG